MSAPRPSAISSRVLNGVCRTRDVVFAGAALAVLSPIFLAVAVCVRIVLGSPVLFRQLRAGEGGKLFWMYKFRTMTSAVDLNGRTLPDSERLHRLGRMLRSWSLDELPGLVNVIKGDMSLVGPRPLLPEYLPLYSLRQARRHEVKPGLTGWAQVCGRNALSWEKRFELDVWYVDNRSLLLDAKILALTVGRVIRREGISAAGEATMSKFEGSKP